MVEARGTSPALEDGTPGYLCEQFRVPRGCLGYVVADPATRLAAIVDPELKMVEPMVDFVFEHGLRPAYIIDTHTHTDHVSGRRNLKSETAARLTMQEKAPSSVVGIRVEEENRLHLGVLPLKFLHTPGHAKDLVGILLPGRVLTPDGILIGSCGRADLLNGSAVRQYHALYHTYKSLPDDLEVWPSHDYKGRSHATLGDEKQTNPKLLFGSEEEFVEFMDLENPQAARPGRAPRGGAQGEHDMKEKEWPR